MHIPLARQKYYILETTGSMSHARRDTFECNSLCPKLVTVGNQITECYRRLTTALAKTLLPALDFSEALRTSLSRTNTGRGGVNTHRHTHTHTQSLARRHTHTQTHSHTKTNTNPLMSSAYILLTVVCPIASDRVTPIAQR